MHDISDSLFEHDIILRPDTSGDDLTSSFLNIFLDCIKKNDVFKMDVKDDNDQNALFGAQFGVPTKNFTSILVRLQHYLHREVVVYKKDERKRLAASIVWKSPSAGSHKLNMDGSSIGNPSNVEARELFETQLAKWLLVLLSQWQLHF
ncbi:hypothetical protein ACH5RR_008408 [Cinchona calisaya]|uniref:Uncharacterized protein n=1 Tax=Cinchona calisaya TaxID=153742 RepID=A0ABD3ABE5_9GENT